MFRLVLMCLCTCVVTAQMSILEQNVTFSKRPVCPTNASLSQLTWLAGSQDSGACFSACAANISCSVLHRSNNICYFGDSSQLAGLFNQSEAQSSEQCESHVRQDVRSKLVVLFDFRKSFSNLVSPGTYDATPRGAVSSDIQGANFPGSENDFIEVDTQNGFLISTFLEKPRNFSFYVKAYVGLDYDKQSTNYHRFYSCISNNEAGALGLRSGRPIVRHRFLTDVKLYKKIIMSPSLHSSSYPLQSFGAVFNGDSLNNFFFNGYGQGFYDSENHGMDGSPSCLRLGYHSDDEKMFKGRIICYAIAKTALSTLEFQQLDQICG